MGGHPQQQEKHARAHTPAEFNQLGLIILTKKKENSRWWTNEFLSGGVERGGGSFHLCTSNTRLLDDKTKQQKDRDHSFFFFFPEKIEGGMACVGCLFVREVEERQGFQSEEKQTEWFKKFNLKFLFSHFTGGRIRAVLGDDLILPAIFSVSNRNQTFLSLFYR